MRFAAQIGYSARPDAVIAMLGDRTFQEQKLAATGALTYSCEISGGGGDGGSGSGGRELGTPLVVRTSRTLPADRIPDAFRTLLPGELRVVQTETWAAAGPDGQRAGTVEVQIPGTPLKMTGQLALAADGHGGTIETVDADLKASIPLIGGRIEKAVAPALQAAIDVEQRLGREWLAGH